MLIFGGIIAFTFGGAFNLIAAYLHIPNWPTLWILGFVTPLIGVIFWINLNYKKGTLTEIFSNFSQHKKTYKICWIGICIGIFTVTVIFPLWCYIVTGFICTVIGAIADYFPFFDFYPFTEYYLILNGFSLHAITLYCVGYLLMSLCFKPHHYKKHRLVEQKFLNNAVIKNI